MLEAIYPDELTVDARILESARQHLDDENGFPKTLLSFTMRLARLASLEPGGKLKHTHPSITIEFPQEYPETSPPLVFKTSGLDTNLMAILQICLEDHSGEESTMQLVTSINEKIQTRNESTVVDYETGIQKREQEEQSQSTLSGLYSQKEVDPDSKPVIGRRIINSLYILKPAKIKDIKKCADELKLGGYAKVGKPGIIVIEGPEEGCKQYCPMLENRGWKHQKVKGEQTKEGPAGGTVDELRGIRNGKSAGGFEFEILGGTPLWPILESCAERRASRICSSGLSTSTTHRRTEARKKIPTTTPTKRDLEKRAGNDDVTEVTRTVSAVSQVIVPHLTAAKTTIVVFFNILKPIASQSRGSRLPFCKTVNNCLFFHHRSPRAAMFGQVISIIFVQKKFPWANANAEEIRYFSI